MRNENLGSDTTALQFTVDAADDLGNITVTVGSTTNTVFTVYANGTAAFPSHTTTERDALANLAAGQTIYNSTTNKLNFYSGSAWEAVTSA